MTHKLFNTLPGAQRREAERRLAAKCSQLKPEELTPDSLLYIAAGIKGAVLRPELFTSGHGRSLWAKKGGRARQRQMRANHEQPFGRGRAVTLDAYLNTSARGALPLERVAVMLADFVSGKLREALGSPSLPAGSYNVRIKFDLPG